MVIVDLVESVILMRRDETSVVRRWQAFVDQTRRLLATSNGGRMINSRADGVLMAFESVPSALATAFSLHETIEATNVGHADDARMMLRAGVHRGDVFVGADDLLGTEVNLTARLAQHAQPGETLVSAKARDGLADSLHAELEDLGDRFLKHIDLPQRLFRARPPGARRIVPASRPPSSPRHDLRPSLAIVPFRALPASAEHDGLGVAMADDIIAALARNPGMRVLSRMSTEALRDAPLEPARAREVLGADYLLRGDNHIRGQSTVLRYELCRLDDAEVLWAGSANADIDALFLGRDELVPAVAAQVSQMIHAHEMVRTRTLPMGSLASYTLMLGAGGLMNSLVPADFAQARVVLEHLAERHSRQAAPEAMLAHWHLFRVAQGWAEDRVEAAARARNHVERALDIDPDLPAARVAAAMACDTIDDDPSSTREHVEQALRVDPGHPHAWVLLASSQVNAGDAETALVSAERGIALSPLDPRRYLFESYAARAAFSCRRHEVAAAHARASVRLNLYHRPSHRLLIGSLWEGGELDAAREATRQYLRLYPDARAASLVDPQRSARKAGRFVEALRRAGLPP